jgi:hypothetical protein
MKTYFIPVVALVLMSGSLARALTCTATCHNSCESTLFVENPDQFSNQKCKDYGGTFGGYEGGNFVCVKYTFTDTVVSGYADLPSEAQRTAYASCRENRSGCNRMDVSEIRGGYSCN